MRWLLGAALVTVLTSSSAMGVSLEFRSSMDPNGDGCTFAGVGETVDLYLYLYPWGPYGATGVDFRISPTDLAITILDFEPAANYLVVPGPEPGDIAMAFGECKTEPFLVGTLHCRVDAPVVCAGIKIQPSSRSNGYLPVFTDCNFAEIPVSTAMGLISSEEGGCPYTPPPILLSPPDGAVNVSLTPSFDWTIAEGELLVCWLLPLGYSAWYFDFGTNPDPPFKCYETICLPVLQPETTYYWRIRLNDFGVWATSPVFSFTTTATTTPVEETTWGRVKALFR
jgi:hypothetical protein